MSPFKTNTLDILNYQIIKCYKYSLTGKELPYDIIELHNERQAIRDRINELQGGDEK